MIILARVYYAYDPYLITRSFFAHACKRLHSFAHAHYPFFGSQKSQLMIMIMHHFYNVRCQFFLLAGATMMTVVACGLLHPFDDVDSAPDPSPALTGFTTNFSVAPDVG